METTMTEETVARTTREALVHLWRRIRDFLPFILAALPIYGLHHLGGPFLAMPALVLGVAGYVWWQRRTASRLAAPRPRP
jgi:hypothetical protein